MLLFTQISADYKLIFVCLPMLLFLNSNKEQISLYAIAFGLLLIPKDYYYLPNIVSDSGAKDISIAVLLNPLIMIAMMCMIIISGLKSNKERINIADTSCGLHR
jgi:ABC-type multidrug transport system permease subunit